MDTDLKHVRLAGAAGIGGAILWALGLLLEDGLSLTKPGSPMYAIDQLIFVAAQLAWVVCIVGLIWGGAVGSGRVARSAPVVMAVGMAVWPIASLLSLAGAQAGFLIPVGILIFTVGSLLTGIAVLVVRRWHGWQRFTPLLQVLYYVVVISLSMAAGGSGGAGEPSLPLLLLWSVPFALLGLALITEGSQRLVVQAV